MLQDHHLVLLGHLLEYVGEPFVVERRGHRDPAVQGQVVQHARGVGRAHLVERRHQVGGGLGGFVAGDAVDIAPLHDVGLPAAPQRLCRLLDGHPAEHPVAGPALFHGHVVDRAGHAAAPDRDTPVQHLPDHQGLGRALLEPAHVEQPRRVDLPAVDVRDPGHRHEDPPPPEDLGNHSQDPGLARLRTHGHHEVADLAHLVALGVEDGEPDEPGCVDARRSGAHGPNASAPASKSSGGARVRRACGRARNSREAGSGPADDLSSGPCPRCPS